MIAPEPAAAPEQPTPQDATLEWEVELDRLDLELMQVERLLAAMKPMEQGDWHAPSPSAPMPEHLLPRAVDIHVRQTALVAKVMRAMRATTRQRAYVDHLDPAQDSTPRYVDLAG